MLAYYRNSLSHLFLNEADIACSLLGFSSRRDLKEGVAIDEVMEKTTYLKNLLNQEFHIRDTLKTKDEFIHLVQLMESRQILSLNDQKIQIGKESEH